MPSLRSLTERVEVGDYLAWVAKSAYSSAGERTYPNNVTEIEERGDTIRVHADGHISAEYYYDVGPDGGSEGYYINQETGAHESRGCIKFAELTDSGGLVKIREGFYDSRDGH